MDAKRVGRSIAFLRSYYGMTQKEIAERLGVTDKAVSRWERGQGVPDISLLSKLSIILDTDIESILEGNLMQVELKWKGILNLEYNEENTENEEERIITEQVPVSGVEVLEESSIIVK